MITEDVLKEKRARAIGTVEKALQSAEDDERIKNFGVEIIWASFSHQRQQSKTKRKLHFSWNSAPSNNTERKVCLNHAPLLADEFDDGARRTKFDGLFLRFHAQSPRGKFC